MDIISWLWRTYSDFTYNLPPEVFSFLLRACLLLLCPIAAAYVGFSRGLRSPKIQTILMVIGLLVAISIPLPDEIIYPSIWRPWLTILLLLGCWFLPVPFSFLAHPRLGTQMTVLHSTRIALAILFVLNLFTFWR